MNYAAPRAGFDTWVGWAHEAGAQPTAQWTVQWFKSVHNANNLLPHSPSAARGFPPDAVAFSVMDRADRGGISARRGPPSSHRRRSHTPGTPASGPRCCRPWRATSPHRCVPSSPVPHRSRRIRSAHQDPRPDPIRTASPAAPLALLRAVRAPTPELPRLRRRFRIALLLAGHRSCTARRARCRLTALSAGRCITGIAFAG